VLNERGTFGADIFSHCADIVIFVLGYLNLNRATTHLENLEKSGNLRVVREKSGKVCSCMNWNLSNWFSGKSLKLLPPDVRF